MTVKECLELVKSSSYQIFVYEGGLYTDFCEVVRDLDGNLPLHVFCEDYRVLEIIPHSTGVNIKAEL